MAEFPSVTVDLSEQLEFPGDSYPLTGKVDVATYTVGEKEYQLQDGIDYDVVFTNAGTGVLLTGMVRAHATSSATVAWSLPRLISPERSRSSTSLRSPRIPRPTRTATSSWVRTASSIWVSPSMTRSLWTRRLWCSASPLPWSVPHLRLQSQRRAMRLRRPGRGRMGRCHGKSICSIEESQAR